MSMRGPGDPDKRDNFLAVVGDEETEAVVKAVIGEMMLPFANVHRGTVRNATDMLMSRRSPKVLLVDISRSDLPVSDMNGLAEACEPGVMVLAIGERNDVGLFRDLISLGVTDYLVKPLSRDLLSRSLAGLVEGRSETPAPARSAGRSGRVIAVTGARGGTGATTFAVNLAWTLANERARRVALVDLDLQFGTASLMLDMKAGQGLREALENPSRIDSLFVERSMARHGERLFVLAAEEPLFDDTTPRLEGVERLLDILKAQFHYVIVDVPRGQQSVARLVASQATAMAVVCDPTLASARDAARISASARADVASQRVYVVANRIGAHKKGELTMEELEKALNRSVDVRVPFDPQMSLRAATLGEPVAAKGGPVAEGVQHLVAEISGSIAPRASGGKGQGRWISRLIGTGARA